MCSFSINLLAHSLYPKSGSPHTHTPSKSAKSTTWSDLLQKGSQHLPFSQSQGLEEMGLGGSSSWSLLYYRHFTFKKKNYYPLWICFQNEDQESCSPWLLLRAVFLFTCVFTNSRTPCHWGHPSPLVPSSLSSPLPTCRTSWSLWYFPHMYIQFPPTING